MTRAQKARAIRLIKNELEKGATEEMLKSMLCAVLGHPPVVTQCFGYLSCARCGAAVGDTLGGASTTEGKVVVGHSVPCEKCDAVFRTLTPRQKLLTRFV